MDHNLMPMQDLVLQLPGLVAAGVPYRLSYCMTENKTVQIRALFSPETSSSFVVDGEVDIDSSDGGRSNKSISLARIN